MASNFRGEPRAAETYMEGKYAAELFMGFGKAASSFRNIHLLG